MTTIDWKRERKIEDVLRRLARQRVVTILQPGSVWVVEQALQASDEVESALTTAYLRGWVEPLSDAVPSSKLTKNGSLPEGWRGFTETKLMYRLTEGGWSVIRRSHHWVLATFWVALATLIATLFAVWISSSSCTQ